MKKLFSKVCSVVRKIVKIVVGVVGATVLAVGVYCVCNVPEEGHGSINSHINKSTKRKKRSYGRCMGNLKALEMTVRERKRYKAYRCPWGDGYHIGHYRRTAC